MNDDNSNRSAAVGRELDKVSTKKMSSHENEDDAPSSEEVQPSSMLIDILHHKLRDPSIVRKFEDSRQDSSTYGLICPRWVLQQAESESDVANDKKSKLDGTNDIKQPNSNRETVYNSYPKRNYIDLRMEQNRMFANDQYDQCKALLAKLSQPSTTSQSTPSTNNDINNNNKQWKKQADMIQSLLNEGLASCPNHVGLLESEKEYKEWIQKRINILSTPSLPTKQSTAAVDKTTPSNSTLLPNSAYSSSMRKGAENRAQAALRDAQLERSFMLDGNAKDDEKDDNNNMYPLLSANDDQQHQDINSSYNKEESSSSGSDTDEDSRRRKKSKRRYKKHKRSKSRQGHHDDRRRRKRDRRSRSRSTSRKHSRSISASSTQTSDSYRRRKHRRKEKKRRNKKNRRRKYRDSRSTRYRSEEDDDDDDVDTGEVSKDEKQAEGSI